MRQGLPLAEYTAAMDPALARAHADLVTWLAGVIVSLFNPERLRALSELFAVFRRLSDPTTVARTLMVQLQYITDVAANMLPDTHTTASGIFRLAWQGGRTSHATAMRLRTVHMHLPQPVAVCLRTPPDTTPAPTMVPAVLPPGARAQPSTSWHVGNVYPFTPPDAFLAWYRNRLLFGPLLLAACTHSRVSPHALSHSLPRCAAWCTSGFRWLVPSQAPSPLSRPRLRPWSRLDGAMDLVLQIVKGTLPAY